MKKLLAALAVLFVLFGNAELAAQPVSHGGIRQVSHDSTLAGTGTVASPLGFAPCVTTGHAYVWNGSAFACTDIATGAEINVGANVIPKGDGTGLVASSWTDDGTTTITTANLRVFSDDASASEVGGISIRGPVTNTKKLAMGYDETLDHGWILAVHTGLDQRALKLLASSVDINRNATIGGNLIAGDADADAHTARGQLTIQKTAVDSNTSLVFQNDARAWSMELQGSASDRLAFIDITGAATLCTLTTAGVFNCTGGFTENGAAVLSGTVGDNVIPKGSSGNLVASSWGDDGTTTSTTLSTFVATGAGAGVTGVFQAGADPTFATAARNGYRVNVWSDGNLYMDHKTFAGGSTLFRSGAGAEAGSARTWLTVTNSTGAAAFGGDVTLGSGDSAVHRLNGLVMIDPANAVDNGSPAIALFDNDDFLYDANYLSHHAFGFYDESAAGGNIPYVSGFFGIHMFTGGGLAMTIGRGTPVVPLSALFPSVTPKVEIIAGEGIGAYNEAVIIRHTQADASAVTRRLGILLKQSNELTDGESDKYVGMISESGQGYANSPDLHLVTNDAKRLSIDASGNVTTYNNLTSGDGAGDVFDHNGTLAKFGGDQDGYTFIYDNTINYGHNQNAAFTGWLNHSGHLASTTQFRNLNIGDGKNAVVATFTGSDKSLAVVGNLSTAAHLGINAPNQLRLNGIADANWYLSKDGTTHDIYLNGSSSGSRAFKIRDSANSDDTRFSVVLATGATTVNGSLTATGNTQLGDATTDSHLMSGDLYAYDIVGTAPTSGANVRLYDSTALAAGVGGGIYFGGKYNAGGSHSDGAYIKAAKTTAVDGDFGFGLSLGTRPNGGSMTERMRISDVGTVTTYADNTFGDATTDVTNISAPTAPFGALNVGGAIASTTAGGAQATISLRQNGVARWDIRLTASADALKIYSESLAADATSWNYTTGLLTHNYAATVLGNTQLGDAATDTLYVPGYAAFGATPTSAQWVTVTGTWNGATATDRYGVIASTNGSLNNDANFIKSVAVSAVAQTLKTDAGDTGSLTNVGLEASASGSSNFNYAIRTLDGDVYFNDTGGTVTMERGGTSRATFTVEPSGALISTSFSTGGTLNQSITRSAAGAGGGDHGLIIGTMSSVITPAGSNADVYGVKMTVTSSRSGAGTVSNVAGYFSASNADTNYAIKTLAGDVWLNSTGGVLRADGSATLGDGLADTLTITAKINSKVYYTSTAPAATTCGTSPVVSGSDSRFKVTTGTGATACTITFSAAYSTNAPVCHVTPADNNDPFSYTVSTSAVTISSAPASSVYYVSCDGWQ